jgi:hypothetical protein
MATYMTTKNPDATAGAVFGGRPGVHRCHPGPEGQAMAEARDHPTEHEQRQRGQRQAEREHAHPGDQREASGGHGHRLRHQLEHRLPDHGGGEDGEDDETDHGAARHPELLAQEGGRHGGEQAKHREPGEAGERGPRRTSCASPWVSPAPAAAAEGGSSPRPAPA